MRGTRTVTLVSTWWSRFWFEPDVAQNLAAARVIVGLHTLWHFLSRDYAAVGALSFLWTDVPQAQRLRYLILDGTGSVDHLLQAVAILALCGVIAGVYPMVSCFVAGVLVYHLAPLETVFWAGQQPTARGLTLAAPALITLACARCGDALALWPRASHPRSPSWEYGWPRKVLWLLVAQIYFFAFVSKMVMTGPSWASADNIRRWLLAFNLSDWWRFSDVGLRIADSPALCLAIGIVTLTFQATFILVLFSRIARYILVPLAAVFGLSTALALNIHVGEGWLILLFVNWAWLSQRIRSGKTWSTAAAQATPT